MCFTIVISFVRPSVFLLVFSMGNRKCTAWLSSLTVLCYLCICTCVFHGKLQYIHTYKRRIHFESSLGLYRVYRYKVYAVKKTAINVHMICYI